MTFEERLKKLVHNRSKCDLHSAMCYFKSGRIAYINANYDKSFFVDIRDENKTVYGLTVAEVLEMFKNEILTRYEM